MRNELYFHMNRRSQHKGIVKGEWLKQAIEAQGTTINAYAISKGLDPEKFYRHVRSPKSKINAESLAELALDFPTLNIRFVLTGQGSPVL